MASEDGITVINEQHRLRDSRTDRQRREGTRLSKTVQVIATGNHQQEGDVQRLNRSRRNPYGKRTTGITAATADQRCPEFADREEGITELHRLNPSQRHHDLLAGQWPGNAGPHRSRQSIAIQALDLASEDHQAFTCDNTGERWRCRCQA